MTKLLTEAFEKASSLSEDLQDQVAQELLEKMKVLITRRGGDRFCLSCNTSTKSPFDVPGIKTQATTRGILVAIRESRSRGAK